MKRLRVRRAHEATVVTLGSDPAMWLAFGLGTGLAPVGPGTMGALLGLPLAWGLRLAGPWVYALATAAIVVLGVIVSGKAARRLGVPDHPGINIDEVAGQLVACAALPLDWRWFGLAFCLFRVLDIAKPGPIAWLDRRLAGGFGIMADDLAAGIVVGASLWALTLVT